MMLKAIVFTGALLALPATCLAYSMDDQMACTPDVYRLCSTFVPNENAITACLARNKLRLSAACRQVFSRPERGNQQNDDNSNGDDDN